MDQTAKVPGMGVEGKEWCEKERREDGDTDLGSPLEVGRGTDLAFRFRVRAGNEKSRVEIIW